MEWRKTAREGLEDGERSSALAFAAWRFTLEHSPRWLQSLLVALCALPLGMAAVCILEAFAFRHWWLLAAAPLVGVFHNPVTWRPLPRVTVGLGVLLAALFGWPWAAFAAGSWLMCDVTEEYRVKFAAMFAVEHGFAPPSPAGDPAPGANGVGGGNGRI